MMNTDQNRSVVPRESLCSGPSRAAQGCPDFTGSRLWAVDSADESGPGAGTTTPSPAPRSGQAGWSQDCLDTDPWFGQREIFPAPPTEERPDSDHTPGLRVQPPSLGQSTSGRSSACPVQSAARDAGRLAGEAHIELLPEEIALMTFELLSLRDRAALGRCSRSLYRAYQHSATVHSGVLDARWGKSPATGQWFCGMSLPAMLDAAARFLDTHRGLNVLRLPRVSSATWGSAELAAELDRVQSAVRSVEVYTMEEQDDVVFMRHGNTVVHDQSLLQRIPLERSAHIAGGPLGAAAVTRLVFSDRCAVGRAPGSSLALLQQQFGGLRDLSTGNEKIAPPDAPADDIALRPFRALHLMGYNNFQTHPEFFAALKASPGLLSVGAREIAVPDEIIRGLPDACPALRHCYLHDCADDVDIDPSSWKVHLATQLPHCETQIFPNISLFHSLLDMAQASEAFKL